MAGSSFILRRNDQWQVPPSSNSFSVIDFSATRSAAAGSSYTLQDQWQVPPSFFEEMIGATRSAAAGSSYTLQDQWQVPPSFFEEMIGGRFLLHQIVSL